MQLEKTKLLRWGPWGKPPAAEQFLHFFQKKNSHLDDVLEQLEKVKLARQGPGSEDSTHWAISAIFRKKKPFE